MQDLFCNDSSALQMNAQRVMPGRISPLDIPSKVEEMRKRKKAEDQDQ